MTAEELAHRVRAAADASAERVGGIGARQYGRGGVQRFEVLELPDLVGEAREEAQDLIAYGVMLDVRLQALQQLVARTCKRHQDAAAVALHVATRALERVASLVDTDLRGARAIAGEALAGAEAIRAAA